MVRLPPRSLKRQQHACGAASQLWAGASLPEQLLLLIVTVIPQRHITCQCIPLYIDKVESAMGEVPAHVFASTLAKASRGTQRCTSRFFNARLSPGCSAGLTKEVLRDPCFDDLLACLAAADADAMPRTAAQVQSVSRILAAVSRWSVLVDMIHDFMPLLTRALCCCCGPSSVLSV